VTGGGREEKAKDATALPMRIRGGPGTPPRAPPAPGRRRAKGIGGISSSRSRGASSKGEEAGGGLETKTNHPTWGFSSTSAWRRARREGEGGRALPRRDVGGRRQAARAAACAGRGRSRRREPDARNDGGARTAMSSVGGARRREQLLRRNIYDPSSSGRPHLHRCPAVSTTTFHFSFPLEFLLCWYLCGGASP
jgi:hypothetical protein